MKDKIADTAEKNLSGESNLFPSLEIMQVDDMHTTTNILWLF